ncbi:AI-2E family transporter [Methanocaldococcus bathoardescens]|nr:AI-2E family transporter [Methanocaldococcus bathoardescens]
MRFNEFKFFRKGIIIGLLIMLLYIIWPFIDVLAYSCAFAYMALPIYNLLRKKFNKTISAGLAISIYILPIMIITIYALITFMEIVFSFNTKSIEPYIDIILKLYNTSMLKGMINEQIFTKYIDEFVKYLINQFSGKIVDMGYLLIKVIMILFITFYFLRDGDKARNLVISFVPKEYKEKMEIYLDYLHDSYKNLFISCVSLSVIITVLSYIGYLIVSVPYAELFAVMTGIFALLPILGGWMVYILIAIYYFLTHDYTKAIFMFIYGEIFLSIAPDFVIRPYLVKKEVDIHPVLVVIAFLMAPLSLGFSGFAIGPLVVGALNAFYLAKYRDRKI